MSAKPFNRPRLLVLASTYPRWKDDYEPGFVHELARRMCGDFEVMVLCPHAPGAMFEEIIDGVHVVRYRYAPSHLETLVNDGGIVGNLKSARWKLSLLPGFFLGQTFALRKLVTSWKPDVIHAHWLIPQGFSVAVLSTIFNDIPPFLVTSHGADLFALDGKLLRIIKKFVVKRSASVSVVSSIMKLKVEDLAPTSPSAQVLPMGVDLKNKFYFESSIIRSGHEILFVGRLVEKKGLKFLINAMPEIVRRHPMTTLTIVGFGPEARELENQVEQLNLSEKVNFVGAVRQKDLPQYYRRAAVFVAPFVEASSGDQEGLGLVLVEALGCGCPSIVSDLPAVDDVTKGLEGVRIVPPGSSSALAMAIGDTLENHDMEKKRAKRASELMKSRFDWESVSKRYSNLLINIMGLEKSR